MKKLINMKIITSMLVTIFALTLSLTANAENLQLQEAKVKITRLELENESLKEELVLYEKKIAKHKNRLEEHDKMNMDTGLDNSE